jgi:hypothetical protein
MVFGLEKRLRKDRQKIQKAQPKSNSENWFFQTPKGSNRIAGGGNPRKKDNSPSHSPGGAA